jgi:hypothetical protein
MNHIQYFSLIFLILKGYDFICIGLKYIIKIILQKLLKLVTYISLYLGLKTCVTVYNVKNSIFVFLLIN